MIGEGLWEGSIVAFDRKLEAYDGDIVVAREAVRFSPKYTTRPSNISSLY
jgi:hypothetical protein